MAHNGHDLAVATCLSRNYGRQMLKREQSAKATCPRLAEVAECEILLFHGVAELSCNAGERGSIANLHSLLDAATMRPSCKYIHAAKQIEQG